MFARRLRGVNLRHAFECAVAWVRSDDARLPRVRAALNEFAADLGGDTEARHIGRELERQEESVTVGSEAASNRRLHQTASVLRVGRQRKAGLLLIDEAPLDADRGFPGPRLPTLTIVACGDPGDVELQLDSVAPTVVDVHIW